MISIRSELPDDINAVHLVHAAAFPTEDEARLVDQLRGAGKARLSLVAELDRHVVGHILFTPVTIPSPNQSIQGWGLAPLAVLPAYQRQGIGTRLVREGLAACRQAGYPFVVVIGHPDYYHRFGFLRGGDFGLRNEFGAEEAFMAVELQPGSLPAEGGLVKYEPEFGAWAV